MDALHYEEVVKIWPSSVVAVQLKSALERMGFQFTDEAQEFQEIRNVRLVKELPHYGGRVWKIFRQARSGWDETRLIETSENWYIGRGYEFNGRWSLVFFLKRENLILEGEDVVC